MDSRGLGSSGRECQKDWAIVVEISFYPVTKVSPKLEGKKIRSCREVNTGQSVFLFF